jgi:hypothetical protein
MPSVEPHYPSFTYMVSSASSTPHTSLDIAFFLSYQVLIDHEMLTTSLQTTLAWLMVLPLLPK